MTSKTKFCIAMICPYNNITDCIIMLRRRVF